MVTALKRDDIRSSGWNVADVRHYKVIYYAGEGGQILVDLDDPITAKVYVLFGG